MPTASIECPKCRKRYSLKAPNFAAMASKPFRCPKCGFAAPFGQLLPHAPAGSPAVALHTHIAGGAKPTPGGKTHVASRPCVVNIVIEKSGRSFPLAQGSYTVGRDSSDSRATLKLAPDPYMSRVHARIDVTPVMAGVSVSIIPMNSANDVFVNNARCNPGVPVPLHDGDSILLGMTTVRVKF